jgi:DNA-binding transcriptional LysR family regulator
MGGSHYSELIVSLWYDKHRENELTVLYVVNNTEGTKMQNLEPILIFITVAEMGSFTHAADSLGIQKGRASTAVRKLEEDVGVRLLHRTTRSVQLTEDGRVFHARARDLLAEVDDLHSMFAGDRVALRGRLRVDLPTEVARTTIVPALPDFMATHPDLELEVSSTDRQVDLVQEGFDCVLRLGPIGDETLIARPLGKLRMVNAASPAYLTRHGVPRSLEDLQRQEHRTIHFSTMLGARPYGWEYPDGDSYATLQLPGALHVNSAQTYEAAALAGLGLIQAPLLGIGRYLESGALVEIIPDFRRRALAVSLVVAHRRNLSRRVRAFMKWIENVLAPYLE